MKKIDTADLIKVAAVVTATPRWVGALLASEGMVIPEAWRGWWIWLSLALNAGMAIVEGFAFSYVFNAWRNQTDRASRRLLWLALLSAGVFVVVLAPYIAAEVRSVPLEQVTGTGWLLWLWSGSVAASTITIVASVGYAQKAPRERKPDATPAAEQPQSTATIDDWRAIYAQDNGSLRDVDAKAVGEALKQRGLAPPSERTLQNWAREAREQRNEVQNLRG